MVPEPARDPHDWWPAAGDRIGNADTVGCGRVLKPGLHGQIVTSGPLSPAPGNLAGSIGTKDGRACVACAWQGSLAAMPKQPATVRVFSRVIAVLAMSPWARLAAARSGGARLDSRPSPTTAPDTVGVFIHTDAQSLNLLRLGEDRLTPIVKYNDYTAIGFPSVSPDGKSVASRSSFPTRGLLMGSARISTSSASTVRICDRLRHTRSRTSSCSHRNGSAATRSCSTCAGRCRRRKHTIESTGWTSRPARARLWSTTRCGPRSRRT